MTLDERTIKWDRHNLQLAKHVAGWSKDPSTQVGSVIVRPDHTIASVGYNGFPRGIEDTHERHHTRSIKLDLMVHAEMNAVLNANGPVSGYTVYIWPFMSCDRCAIHLIQAGISRVVAPVCPVEKLDTWGPIFAKTKLLYDEAGVTYTEYENIY